MRSDGTSVKYIHVSDTQTTPNCISSRPWLFLKGMPITVNTIHTMKHTVNAVVLAVTTDQLLQV